MSEQKDIKSTQEKRRPGHSLTDEEREVAQRTFLASFAKKANVLLAAKAAKVARNTIYEWLEKDADFSFAYNQAKEDAKDIIRAEIYRRGKEGWNESVYESGVLTKTVRKYSDTLLIFHAKAMMPEYRDKSQVDVTSYTQVQRDPAYQSLSDEELEILERASTRLARHGE
jgi:hypothetical protein